MGFLTACLARILTLPGILDVVDRHVGPSSSSTRDSELAVGWWWRSVMSRFPWLLGPWQTRGSRTAELRAALRLRHVATGRHIDMVSCLPRCV